MTEWLLTSTVVELAGCNDATVRRWISSEKVVSRKSESSTGGRRGYEILLTSLPAPIQDAYRAKQLAADTSARAVMIETAVATAKTAREAKRIMTESQDADVAAALVTIHESARSRITRKLALCEAARAADLFGKSRVHPAMIEFCRHWNEEHTHTGEKPITPKYLETQLLKYRHNGAVAFLGEGNRGGWKRNTTTVPDEMQAIFVPYALREQVGSYKRGYEAVRGHYAAIPGFNMTTIPSLDSFVRRLHRDVSQDVIDRCTKGVDWWKQRHADFVQKSSEGLFPGEVWVSDHMECPVVVRFDDGTTGKPWLTSWMDYRSHRLLGWDIHKGAGNADHLFLTFKRGCERVDETTDKIFYELPRDVLTDNGREYKARDLAGDLNRSTAIGKPSGYSDEEQRRCRALYAGLNVRVHFSIPYNSDGKPIERMHGIWQGFFFDYLPMATGRSVHKKRFGGMGQKADAKETAAMLTIEALREMFKFFLNEIWDKRVFASGERKGQSPGMIWKESIAEAREKGVIRKVEEVSLILFCMRTTQPRQISKNGIKDAKLNRYYWAEWMSDLKGTSVYMRRDPQKWDKAYVFEASSDRFLGVAAMGAVCDAIVRDDAASALLSEEMRRVSSDKRRVENARKVLQGAIAPESHLGGLAALAAMDEKAAIERRIGDTGMIPVSSDPEIFHANLHVTPLDNVGALVAKMEAEGLQEIPGMVSISGDDSDRYETRLFEMDTAPKRPRLFETEADKIRWEEEQMMAV